MYYINDIIFQISPRDHTNNMLFEDDVVIDKEYRNREDENEHC